MTPSNIAALNPQSPSEVNKTGLEIMVRFKQESRSSGKFAVKSTCKSGARSYPVTAGQVHHDGAGLRLSWKIRLQIKTIQGQA